MEVQLDLPTWWFPDGMGDTSSSATQTAFPEGTGGTGGCREP